MNPCGFFRWLICTVGQLQRRIVGEGSKTSYINEVMSSAQLMNHFSSRPHPAGFCRTILLVFSIAASAPGFVNPECFFSLKQNYRKFQNKRIFCKGGKEGEEEEKKRKKKFNYKLSTACALNLKQTISYTDPWFFRCPSCSLSQLPRHTQSQHLTFPVIGFGGSCSWLALPLTVCLLVFLDCM